MLQDVRLQCISEVLKVITREFGIDSLVHELKPDEGKKTLISLIYLQNDDFPKNKMFVQNIQKHN